MDFKPVYIVMTKTCHFKAAFATESEAETYIKENNNHFDLEFYQSNYEGDIVTKIQESLDCFAIMINPAAYTHTSIALLDALKAVMIPSVEVHISDLTKREDFRQISYAGMACVKSIKGHGFKGYLEAIDFLINYKK